MPALSVSDLFALSLITFFSLVAAPVVIWRSYRRIRGAPDARRIMLRIGLHMEVAYAALTVNYVVSTSLLGPVDPTLRTAVLLVTLVVLLSLILSVNGYHRARRLLEESQDAV